MRLERVSILAVLVLMSAVCGVEAQVAVVAGSPNDYAPCIARDGGRVWICFDRMDESFDNGDIFLTHSNDGGLTWSAPVPVVTGPGNQCLSSLVIREGWMHLFYSSNETGSYQIRRTRSPDGMAWEASTGVDLGWATGDVYDPTVCVDGQGTWGMTFVRMGEGVFFASATDGVNWARTFIAAGYRPRVCVDGSGAWRAVFHQKVGVGSYDVVEYGSETGRFWASSGFLTSSGNNHDPFALRLGNRRLGCWYAKAVGSHYDVYRRLQGADGAWAAEEPVATGPGYQTQPHATLDTDGAVLLAWAHSTGSGGTACDIYFQRFPGPPVLGDLDGDGVAGTADVVLLAAYLAEQAAAASVDPASADFDGDGRVTAADLAGILAAASG